MSGNLSQRVQRLERDPPNVQEVLQKVQTKLNLPLPPGADIAEGLRRLKRCLKDHSLFPEFAEWTAAQHAAHRKP